MLPICNLYAIATAIAIADLCTWVRLLTIKKTLPEPDHMQTDEHMNRNTFLRRRSKTTNQIKNITVDSQKKHL